ncbi:CDP-glucose 4,6-dehydratase, partial [Pseudomonas sp. FW306-2-11AD]
TGPIPHEAGLLRLDSSRARGALGWCPALTLGAAIDWIVDWHKAVADGADVRAVTQRQVAHYAEISTRSATAMAAG